MVSAACSPAGAARHLSGCCALRRDSWVKALETVEPLGQPPGRREPEPAYLLRVQSQSSAIWAWGKSA